MTIQNDFLPFAASENANVLSQADYQKLVSRRVGFESGVAIAKQLNKVWRQSSLMAAALAQFMVEQSQQPVIDDGTTETIVRRLHAAIQQVEVAWSKIVDTPTTLAGYGITDAVNVKEKGQAGGVATLNDKGQVPQAQWPRLASSVNKIINGDFAINQRGYRSGMALSAGAYGFDRWKAGDGGAALEWMTATPRSGVRITRGSIQQVMEGGGIEGGSYTLSWRGTALARIDRGAWAASPITTELIASQPVTVEWGEGTVAQVKLEAGITATPWESRLPADELHLCQRYYEKSYRPLTPPGKVEYNVGNPNAIALPGVPHLPGVPFKVTKCSQPAVVIYRPSTGAAGWLENFREQNPVPVVGLEVSENGIGLISLGRALDHLEMYQYQWSADAEL